MIIDDKKLIQEMVDSLNLNHLKKKEQDKIVSELIDIVLKKVVQVVFNELTEEEKVEFAKIVKNPKGDMIGYLNDKISNLGEVTKDIARETMNDFRKKRLMLAST